MAGICDDRQNFCFGLALWNGKDPIIKERMFGLGGDTGNHGEDVKDYFHGDSGAGLGASHQTGWTALVLDLILTLRS